MGGVTQTPADYLQGESVRILYIHVPTAWLGTGAWTGIAVSSIVYLAYLAYLALARANAERGGDGRIPALFGIAGSVLLPVIRYSVVWWSTLHQGASITLSGSSIDGSLLWPLGFTITGFSLFFAGVVLMRMRALLASARVEARMRRMAAA